MPLISVNEQGDNLFYEDTGAPAGASEPYTTFIVVHGTAFHSGVFRRLLPLAPRYRIRLVLVNRRDYPKSSPYTEDDITKIRGNDAVAHDEFARERGNEFAVFIRHFVEQENVPKVSSDRKSGGVVLMAWSSGNGYTLPMLSYADSIPADTREAIAPFLRSFMIFDAPRWILGLPTLEHGFDVLRDDSLTLEERARRFSEWVGAYYTHASLSSRDMNDLQLVADAGARTGTTLTMSADDERAVTCYDAVQRSEVAARTAAPEIYAERVRRALFDDTLAQYWPKCSVDVVWCEHSPWAIVDGVWGFERLREKADEEGIKGRQLRFFMIPGANHFPHWDEPEKTMKFFAKVLGSLVSPKL
ncbi:hypothetical protein DFH11DRAFT_1513177 [Phellopilus nigrolimitatus]|nr:hypothetical protein DFH11DRAFT_1513177 [Phellopilus nigrolimitatus]